MFRNRETNPHFLPRNNDPVIEFPSQPPHQGTRHNDPPVIVLPSRSRSRPPAPHQSRTSIEPPHGPRPQPPTQQTQPQPQPQPKLLPPHLVDTLPQHPQESTPHSRPPGPQPYGIGHRAHSHPSLLRAPTSRRTRPIAWLVAAFCALFWMIIIVGGLIILIVYLVFRPRNPRFDISSVTFNAAYLDMGYLLNADVTLLANFTNPNTKVNVDFGYVILDLYFERNFIATRYIEPFSVKSRESRFADVHMMTSQVRLSNALSLELQRQIESGRVNFEIKGLFKSRSKLGGILHYTYWMNAHCEIAVTGPPTGVLIGKRCVTKR